ncbi:WhiB family transcriptional regulator [Isoptericola sp. NPDC056605]|uniref:WhiB family transcriptional regulator n=1 Tax=Isoptericola sp. NPDC056605 TaxID=3345876 RepID=UPI0036790B30
MATLTYDEEAQALCAQVGYGDIWFPDKGGSTREAKQICAECPIATRCLEVALANGERHGIWGGVSERDRRKLAQGRPTGPEREHGTARGYRQHKKHGEDVCKACDAAYSVYQREHREARERRAVAA